MKFDVAVGNPPYQADSSSLLRKSIYNLFMDKTYRIADITVLITPAKFLFNAGTTPTDWNKKMLNDKHLCVPFFETYSYLVFPHLEITGGVAVTLYDNNADFGAITVYSPFAELNSLCDKAMRKQTGVLSDSIYPAMKFDTECLLAEHPEYRTLLRERRLSTNIFTRLSVFTEKPQSEDDSLVYGFYKAQRAVRYMPTRYFEQEHQNLYKWKVLLPKAYGHGVVGGENAINVIGVPFVAEPKQGYTHTYISVGSFDTEQEAQNCLKYLKTRFVRALVGILKVTQNNNKEVWKLVPVQDFTRHSDIDWSVPVSEIDRQLYRKYGLTEKEIAFLDIHLTAMQ